MKGAQQGWNAAEYAGYSSGQLQWARELMQRLALQGDESLLDIGCGDGKVSAEIANALKGGFVLGVDLSQQMIRHAKENFPPERFPNLEFQCMDAADLRLEGSFDIAFSNAALHWVEDHIAVLKGIRSALRSGGKILLQMGGRGNAAEMFSVVHEVIRDPKYNSYFRNFTSPYFFYAPEDYIPWLEKCGFQALRVELIEKDMLHSGMEALLGWLRTTWFPFADPLPHEMREIFFRRVAERYGENNPSDASGGFHVKMVRLEVEAVS